MILNSIRKCIIDSVNLIKSYLAKTALMYGKTLKIVNSNMELETQILWSLNQNLFLYNNQEYAKVLRDLFLGTNKPVPENISITKR